MQPEVISGVFGGFDPLEYRSEAEWRWGHTSAYKESVRRTRSYTREDWKRIQDENIAVTRRMLAAFDSGVKPEDTEAMNIAEEARRAIDRAFYACTHEMHATLAEAYVRDERFRAFYDRQREGLAAWFAAAIKANRKRAAAEQ